MATNGTRAIFGEGPGGVRQGAARKVDGHVSADRAAGDGSLSCFGVNYVGRLIPRTLFTAILLAALAWPSPGLAQSRSAIDEQASHDRHLSRQVSYATLADAPAGGKALDSDALAVTAGNPPHRVGLGLYGLYEPDIFPTETWVQIGCFAEYGRGGDAPDFVRVDVLLYDESWNIIWDTREGGRDFGVCLFSRGVDTTIVDIPRGFEFHWWQVMITRAEQARENVQTGVTWSAPPYNVNSFEAGVTAINLKFDGVPAIRR